MARWKHYLPVSVVDAAKARIRHLYETFDSVVVSFSGGKDSLVVLHLCHEIAREMGRLPVLAKFHDEELIPDEAVEFVTRFRNLDWLDLKWYCLPVGNEVVVLSNRGVWIQWDKARYPDRWLRPMPEWGIRMSGYIDPATGKEAENMGIRVPDEYRVFASQHEMDDYLVTPYRGKVAFVMGIRAAESIMRYRSVVNKLNENWINASGHPRIRLAKPIYDWEENDVMKWLHEEGHGWNHVYDIQHLAGDVLRMATPLHGEGSKHSFGRGLLRRKHPEMYNRLISIWPEMSIQERYYRSYDAQAKIFQYSARGWNGVMDYIKENVNDPFYRRMAVKRLREHMSYARVDPEAYPPEVILKALISGVIDSTLLPLGIKERQQMREKRRKYGVPERGVYWTAPVKKESEHAGH